MDVCCLLLSMCLANLTKHVTSINHRCVPMNVACVNHSDYLLWFVGWRLVGGGGVKPHLPSQNIETQIIPGTRKYIPFPNTWIQSSYSPEIKHCRNVKMKSVEHSCLYTRTSGEHSELNPAGLQLRVSVCECVSVTG